MAEWNAAISGCVVARNEERRIEDALRSLQGWVDQIVVIDNGSQDCTVDVARRYTEHILSAPGVMPLGGLRNRASEAATGGWIFFLDADERVPSRLGPVLKEFVRERGDEFEALCIPCKHFFCGRWMRQSGWWPGYKGPQLVKARHFRFNEGTRGGLTVGGRTLYLPAEDDELAVIHQSYESIDRYLEKLIRYSSDEAECMLAEGGAHGWEAQVTHFVQDLARYYDDGRADLDGMHGFVLAFLTAFCRFVARAKLWEFRQVRGEAPAREPVPASIREVLEWMGQTLQQETGPRVRLPAGEEATAPTTGVPPPGQTPDREGSGLPDGVRDLVAALIAAGESLVVAGTDEEAAGRPGCETRVLVGASGAGAEAAAELCITAAPVDRQLPIPNARVNVARTRFESDWLPSGTETALNRFDRVWVPSEFNRETFVRSGVEPEKIAVVPEPLDSAPFGAAELEPWPLPGEEAYRFLSIFDWTLRKGWDVLLEAFATEFGEEPQVGLVLMVRSSLGYSLEEMRAQAEAHLRSRLGRGLGELANIHFWEEDVAVRDLPRVYRSAEAFVLPSRGESRCRPLMEAMAAGLPTIATAWGGAAEYHNDRVGYPLACRCGPVSAASARETPQYAGHCWAEPDGAELRRLMRQLVEDPQTARGRGMAARGTIAHQYSPSAVARLLREELARCRRPTPGSPACARPAARPEPAAAPRLVSPVQRPAANPIIHDPVAEVDFRERLGRRLRVRWECSAPGATESIRAARELWLGLFAAGDVELTIAAEQAVWLAGAGGGDRRYAPLAACFGAELSGLPDVTVRQSALADDSRPAAGKLVVFASGDEVCVSDEWRRQAAAHADEVWVESRWVRDAFVRGGVPAEKVRIVPGGFDPTVFRAEGPRFALPTRKALRFLFVGRLLRREGADLLLAAYRQAFTAADDVCLVVHPEGSASSDEERTLTEEFARAQSDPTLPEVVLMDGELTGDGLASLYRAGSGVVLPYRAERFGLPALEGMACGVPAIVTSGGATDDFLDDSMALRVPHRRVGGAPGLTGALPREGEAHSREPDLGALVGALHWVRDHPEGARGRGARAREYVAGGWTWEYAVGVARQRLWEQIAPLPETRAVVARPWAEPALAATADEGGGPQRGSLDLSLCLIARDEERRIAECLNSIAPFVNEMVVVDTGSRDRTREVALQWGARVFDCPWVDCFATARNESLKQARGRWIFWMDADDTISPECGRELRELIRGRPNADAAFQVQVRIPPGPGEFGESVVDHIKLFPNRPELRFEHRIHEQILPALRRAGLPVIGSRVYVTHQNYDRSPEGQQKKRRRDFRLLELELRERPGHPFVLFNLGMTHLMATRDYEVAAQYLRRCLNGSDWRDSIVRKAYALLATARLRQEEYGAALEANREGREHYPEDAELLFQAAQIYQQLGQTDAARQALERLVSGQEEPYFRSVDMGLRTYRGRHELALLLRRGGDGGRAAAVLREIATAFPEYLPARLDLVETLCLLGDRDEARRLLAGIPAQPAIEGHLAHLRRLADGSTGG